MKIFVINLDRSSERMAFMERQLAENGLAAERIAAIDGLALEPAALRDHGTLPPGAVGCFLSHRKLWRKMVDEDIPLAMVLEDDARISPRLNRLFATTGWMPAGMDLVRLESTNYWRVGISPRPAATIDGRKLHRVHGKGHGTAAYILTRKAAKLLLAASESFDQPVDMFMTDAPQIRSLGIYQMVPAPVTQLSTDAREGHGIFTSTITQIDFDRIGHVARTPRNFYRAIAGFLTRMSGRLAARLGLGGFIAADVPYE